ncbi:glycosyltransferase [Rhodobacter maris]|uniref:Glycosyltransferase involved in cell wall bisynthesis n=1 Tax=Rhodobacter maris TaxID=446682 RepID=A0A285SID2_9RHOB|nr:glycosyltransferase [Rhodobacter maris]SOC05588.1 glycosyltransferase involved in cell wall bisynthesis [Rhodobacter maris]
MSKNVFLRDVGNIRSQLIDLCERGRYASAQFMLAGAGCNAQTHPALWEYLARQSAAAGVAAVAHAARRLLWEAGWRTADVALSEARHFLDAGDHVTAVFLIEHVFGKLPEDPAARLLLARCHLETARARGAEGPTRTDAEAAQQLSDGIAPETADDLLLLVDLLRFAGEFDAALAQLAAAADRFGGDPRLTMRAASIQEQRGDIAAALALWQEVTRQPGPTRKEALFRQIAAQARLGRSDAVTAEAGALLRERLSLAERIRLALLMGQHGMVEALTDQASQGGDPADPLGAIEAAEIGDMLLDAGYIGLVHWLRRQKLGVSERAKTVLEAVGLGLQAERAPRRSFATSVTLRSPDFMVPIAEFLQLPPKPAGWPGEGRTPEKLLLVNFSLAAGGAERQLLELVKALLADRLTPDQIDVACFTLARDRGHDRFLPELQALGVSVHNLMTRRIANRTLPPEAERLISALPLPLRDDTRAIWHLVNELRPDVLHGWQDKSALACGLVGHLLGLGRVVLSLRNMSPETRRDPDLVRLRALYGDFAATGHFRLTANAEAAIADYAGWIGCAPERLTLLRNAVDDSRFSPALRAPGAAGTAPLRIVGIFRLAPNKRPLLWLRTVAALARQCGRPLCPVIHGSGPLGPEIVTEARALGLDGIEIHSGSTAPEDLYGSADLVLLMSRVEGVPNILIEAQACGIPVAACDVGGVREAMHDSGLLLPADPAPEAAAAALAAWLPAALTTDPARRVAFAQRRFGRTALATRAMALYCGTAEEP